MTNLRPRPQVFLSPLSYSYSYVSLTVVGLGGDLQDCKSCPAMAADPLNIMDIAKCVSVSVHASLSPLYLLSTLDVTHVISLTTLNFHSFFFPPALL